MDLSYCADVSLENLHEVRAFIDHAGRQLGVDEAALADLRLAVDEAVTNIIVHGYQGQGGEVEVGMRTRGDGVEIRVCDQARSFSSDHVNPPQLDTSLAERPFGGMGVFLIDKMTDRHEYRALPGGGNELVMFRKAVISPR